MKLNIHAKVLLLVLGAGLTTFLVLGAFAYYGRTVVHNDMKEMSIELGNNSASYTDTLIIRHLKETFGKLAEAKAQFLDNELLVIRGDAAILATAMTHIMSNPQEYNPQTVSDPRNVPIKNTEPYIIFAPDVANNVTPEMQQQIALAANIKYLLTDLIKAYETLNGNAFVGSEAGWYICAAISHEENGNTSYDAEINFSRPRVYEYDCRKRPWYIAAKEANAPALVYFYDLVGPNKGDTHREIGASLPFYDAQGNMIGVAGIDCSNTDLYRTINNFLISNDTINFVLNEKGALVFSSTDEGVLSLSHNDIKRDIRNVDEKTLAAAATRMVAGEQGVVSVTLGDDNFYLAFSPMSCGWSFGMLVPEETIMSQSEITREYFMDQVNVIQEIMMLDHSYVNNVVIGLPLTVLVILILFGFNLSRRFVKPIKELNNGVKEISGGNLDKKLNIKTNDEIEHLAESFNAMTDEIKTYMENLTKVTAERERIATELDVAKDIQNGMLPKDFPVREDFELYATMTPAKEVGGDFYDFYQLDETHLAITVADVSGKGIAAALFMRTEQLRDELLRTQRAGSRG